MASSLSRAAFLLVLIASGCQRARQAPDARSILLTDGATDATSQEVRDASDSTAPANALSYAPLAREPWYAVIQDATTVRDAEKLKAAFTAVEKSLASEKLCKLRYDIGLRLQTWGEYAPAISFFEKVAESHECELQTVAAWRLAQNYALTNDPTSVLRYLERAAADQHVMGPTLRARALDQLGKQEEALAAWELVTRRARNGESIFGEALASRLKLCITLPFDQDHVTKAIDQASEFVVAFPLSPLIKELDKLIYDAKVVLRTHGGKASLTLTSAQRLDRAHSLRRQHEAAQAVAEVTAVLAAISPADPLRCEALTFAFEVAKPKARAKAKDAAVRGCKGKQSEPALRMVLAKAEGAAGNIDGASRIYASIHKNFTTDRLAPDALMASGMLAVKNGDEATASTHFAKLAQEYPDSRHSPEALFRVALFAFREKRWPDSVKHLDVLCSQTAKDHHWSIAGRAQYFRARTAELSGDLNDAKTRYASVIREFPLAHYMGMAYARLAKLDAAAAEKAFDDAERSEPTEPWPGLATAQQNETVAAGRSLIDVGDSDLGLEQLAVVRYESLENLLLASRYANRAGLHRWGHAFARTDSPAFLEHHAAGKWRDFWLEAFPNAYSDPDLVGAASRNYHVPKSLILAIMREESAFQVDVTSSAKAYGLMQMILSTAKHTARGTAWSVTPDGLKTPEMSIDLGTKHLAQLLASFKATPLVAPAAYNAGPGALRRWLQQNPSAELDVFIEDIPYEETRNYVKRVYASQLAYASLYERSELKNLLALPTRAW